jgi:hypothetical protein
MATVTIFQGTYLPGPLAGTTTAVSQLRPVPYGVQRFMKQNMDGSEQKRQTIASLLGQINNADIFTMHWSGQDGHSWQQMDFAPSGSTSTSRTWWSTSASFRGLDQAIDLSPGGSSFSPWVSNSDLDLIRQTNSLHAGNQAVIVMHNMPFVQQSNWLETQGTSRTWTTKNDWGGSPNKAAALAQELLNRYPGRIKAFAYGQEYKETGLNGGDNTKRNNLFTGGTTIRTPNGTNFTTANLQDFVDGYNTFAAYAESHFPKIERWFSHLDTSQRMSATQIDTMRGGGNDFGNGYIDAVVDQTMSQIGIAPGGGFDATLLPDRWTYDASIASGGRWVNDYANQVARLDIEYHIARVLQTKMMKHWGRVIPIVGIESYFDWNQSSVSFNADPVIDAQYQDALSTGILMWAQRAGTSYHHRWEPQAGDAAHPTRSFASWWNPINPATGSTYSGGTVYVYNGFNAARDLSNNLPPLTRLKVTNSDNANIIVNAGHTPSGQDKAFILNTSASGISTTIVSKSPDVTVTTVTIPAHGYVVVDLPPEIITGTGSYSDDFNRTVAAGWGTSTPVSAFSRAWSIKEGNDGTNTALSVAGAQGVIKSNTVNSPATATLPVASKDITEVFKFSIDKAPVGGTAEIDSLVRYVDPANHIRVGVLFNPSPPIPPPSGLIVQDDFSRTVSNDWGNAPVGGTWTRTGGSNADYNVGSNVGTIVGAATVTHLLYQMTTAATDGYASADFILPVYPSSSATEIEIGLRVRQQTPLVGYRGVVVVSPTGALSVQVEKWTDSSATAPTPVGTSTGRTSISPASGSTATGLTVPTGVACHMVLDVRGTQLRFKAWPNTVSEPDWQINVTDSTPQLQSAGGMLVGNYTRSGVSNLSINYANVIYTTDVYVPTAGTQVIYDNFTRTAVSPGWGSASLGGAWSLTPASANFSTNGSQGIILAHADGNTRAARITSPNLADGFWRLYFTLPSAPVGGNIDIQLGARVVALSPARIMYRASCTVKTDGTFQLFLQRHYPDPADITGATTKVDTIVAATNVLVGQTLKPGIPYAFLLDCRGFSPTNINAKVFPTDATQPPGWQISTTDSTSRIQAKGGIWVGNFLNTGGTDINVTYDDAEANGAAYDPGSIIVVPDTIFDDFNRADSTSGWGTPSIGTAWQASNGNTGVGGDYSIASNVGRMNVSPGGTRIERILTSPVADSYVSGKFMTPVIPTGGNLEGQLGLRILTSPVFVGYRLIIRVTANTGALMLLLEKWTNNAGVSTQQTIFPATSVGINAVVGTFYKAVLEVRGSSITGKIWPVGGIEPSTWLVSVTDTSLTSAGGIHVGTFLQSSASSVVATDDFGRTATSGWGTAVQGGTWTHNTAADFSANGSTGKVSVSAYSANRVGYLGSTSARDVDIVFRAGPNALPTGTSGTSGGSQFIYGVARRIDSSNEYRVKLTFAVNGTVTLQASVVSAGTETNLGSPVTVTTTYNTMTPGTYIWVRAQFEGASPTTIRARSWITGTEPTSWAYTTTDSTSAVQVAGNVGLRTFIGSSTIVSNALPVVVNFDDFVASQIGTGVNNILIGWDDISQNTTAYTPGS